MTTQTETEILLVGNPNCGKSTLFNALTGGHQLVGNWPGVSVEKVSGLMVLPNSTSVILSDLPGLYSLNGENHSGEDEKIARDAVLSNTTAPHSTQQRIIVNVVDGANLERNLYLTSQLLEMATPMIVAVTMIDMAQDRGLLLRLEDLSLRLGCPVVGVCAPKSHGIKALADRLLSLITTDPSPNRRPALYPDILERSVTDLAGLIEPLLSSRHSPPRWVALSLLEGHSRFQAVIGHTLDSKIAHLQQAIEDHFGEEADIAIADARFQFVSEITKNCVLRTRQVSRNLSDRIDRYVLDRILGIPIFLLMMYVMFLFTISIGGAFIDFFDQTLFLLVVEPLEQGLLYEQAPGWLVAILVHGLGAGLQTIATFIPVIGALFLFLSFLEESGYMARAAFVMDRAMRTIGLPGKSFVPLIVGFGCNVPAIMATRTLENRRDRIMTIMMAPFMSCGARLPVYAVFAAAFFPIGGQNIVFLLYVIGVLFAIATGFLLKFTVLQGDATPFVLELPAYHLPRFSTLWRRAKSRLAQFLFRAGKIIMPMVVLLGFLNHWHSDGRFGATDENSQSMLAVAGQTLTPLFAPIGLRADNWPAAVGLFTGIFAKEAIIGTLNSLYSQTPEPQSDLSPSLAESLLAAAATIPDNLAAAGSAILSPFATSLDTGDHMSTDAMSSMSQYFDGQAGAFAYLLLILLYMPCVAATGAIAHEIGWRWTVFSAAWTSGLGYAAATVFYQSNRLGDQPAAATAIIALTLLALGAAMLLMRWSAASEASAAPCLKPDTR